jgi:hypothetical protein
MVMDPINLNCKGTFTGHTGPVWGLAHSEEAGLLISASSDMTIKVRFSNSKILRNFRYGMWPV